MDGRWDNVGNLWPQRLRLAAAMIPNGSSVLDLGAGSMALEEALAPDCTYQAADVIERRPGACLIVDLNARQFPSGRYDWIVVLGVVEYVRDVPWLLASARETATCMAVSYCCDPGAEAGQRRDMGWVNDMSVLQFESALKDARWAINERHEMKRNSHAHQNLYSCSHAP